MNSTGNDIVALQAINKQRSNDSKFYSKFITRSEQALYHHSTVSVVPFENYVWLLWSVKESAYKYLKRGTPGLVFSPTKIIIQSIEIPNVPLIPQLDSSRWESSSTDDGFYRGKVAFANSTLYFRSIIHNDFISTVVDSDSEFTNIYWGVEVIGNSEHANQSTSVRLFILNKLKSLFPGDDLRIGKSEAGYPIILNGEKEIDIPLSIAHHQLFTAYSIKLFLPKKKFQI